MAAGQAHAELEAIYKEHCPDKLQNIPVLLGQYSGREALLLKKVRAKYAIPTAAGAVGAESVTHNRRGAEPTNAAEQMAPFLSDPNFVPHFTHGLDQAGIREVLQQQGCDIRQDLLPLAQGVLDKVLARFGTYAAFAEQAFGPPISQAQAAEHIADYLARNRLTGSVSVKWTDSMNASGKVHSVGPLSHPERRTHTLYVSSRPSSVLTEHGIQAFVNHEVGRAGRGRGGAGGGRAG
jgi:hypothetical protein